MENQSSAVYPAIADDIAELASIFRAQPIDAPIARLVRALNTKAVVTQGSCCGHGRQPAYIDLAVHGLAALRGFIEHTNRVQGALEERVLMDVSVNWSGDTATACDFERYPDWIMLTLTVEDGYGRPPCEGLLAATAEAYEHTSRPEAP
jgi:hypothetical protein